jgi:hypothetical protein
MGIYVGIDPGKSGFTLSIDKQTGRFLRADPQPLIGDGKGDTFDLNAMRELVKEWKDESDGELFVVLEELKPMGGSKGILAAWNQALGYMAWKAVMSALKVRYVTKNKGHMKKVMGVETPKRVGKKPEPTPPKGKRPKKLGKKATPEQHQAWIKECAAWDQKKADYDEKLDAWKKADRARLTKWRNAGKLEAIKVAQQYFPDVDFKRTPRCKGPDDNKCEAGLYALMASKIDPRAS